LNETQECRETGFLMPTQEASFKTMCPSKSVEFISICASIQSSDITGSGGRKLNR